MATAGADDLFFVRALLAGDAERAELLLRQMKDTIWQACAILTDEDTDRRQAFLEACTALRADSFRILRRYDGRVSLNRYVALAVRQILAKRLRRLVLQNPNKGWVAFETFFRGEINGLIGRYFREASASDRDDVYQAVQIGLIDNDYRRIRQYSGDGSFREFILSTVENLIRDFVRHQKGRRREPAVVQRFSPLDRAVFNVMYGDDRPWLDRLPRPEEVFRTLSPELTIGLATIDVAAAIERVLLALPAGYNPGGRIFVSISSHAGEGDFGSTNSNERAVKDNELSDESDGEKIMIREETDRLTSAALAVLVEAAKTWPTRERDRFHELLAGSASRKGRPPEAIDRSIRQRVAGLAHHPEVRAWLIHAEGL
jgi:DNA-directed RNA polymerase specialized sigma24 family protein